MKTADLIPFILLELTDEDKYGFELIKAIETKSNGKIVIKQPTLYTVLKKLEKSKFITSYWQDSEIGGKRHYYKLTENGRLQVSTLPSYEFLLNNILNEDDETEKEENQEVEVSVKNTESSFSILDQLRPDEPKETILPSEEVFAEESSLDNQTEFEINLNNTEVLKDEKNQHEENFATNKDVVKFTEKITTPTKIAQPTAENKIDILDLPDIKIASTSEPIKYVDYTNFKKDEKYIKSKKIAKSFILKSFLTSFYMLIMVALCDMITNFTGKSAIYYVFMILSILYILFNPIAICLRYDKIRLKYQANGYNTNFRKQFVIALCCFLIVMLSCIILSLYVGKIEIISLFAFNNFANIYAPLVYCTTLFADVLIELIIKKKLNA